MTRMKKILIAEDDPDIGSNVADYIAFSDTALHAEVVAEGFDAFSRAATDPAVSLLVLDIGLPGLDGIQVCRRLRNIGWTKPVIMLTARDTIEDRVRGLECGADDYLIKPFSLAELLARIRAQLRRQEQNPGTGQILQVSDLVANLHTWEFSRAGQALKLNPTLAKILIMLMKASPGVVTRQTLADALWQSPPSDETLRTHIYRLRQTIDKPFGSALLHTVAGVGWALREPGRSRNE